MPYEVSTVEVRLRVVESHEVVPVERLTKRLSIKFVVGVVDDIKYAELAEPEAELVAFK